MLASDFQSQIGVRGFVFGEQASYIDPVQQASFLNRLNVQCLFSRRLFQIGQNKLHGVQCGTGQSDNAGNGCPGFGNPSLKLLDFELNAREVRPCSRDKWSRCFSHLQPPLIDCADFAADLRFRAALLQLAAGKQMVHQCSAQARSQAPGRLGQRKTGSLAELFGAESTLLPFTGSVEWDFKVGSKGEGSTCGNVTS